MKNNTIATDHLGNEYKSLTAMCNAYDIPRTTYIRRLERGWEQEAALTTPSGNTVPISYVRVSTEERVANEKARQKAYREEHKEEYAARRKAYYEEHKEKELARKKAYREANKEKIAAYQKAYREANKEKELAREKARYEARKEETKTQREGYKKEHIAYREIYDEQFAEYAKDYYEECREEIDRRTLGYTAQRKANKEELAGKTRKEELAAQRKTYEKELATQRKTHEKELAAQRKTHEKALPVCRESHKEEHEEDYAACLKAYWEIKKKSEKQVANLTHKEKMAATYRTLFGDKLCKAAYGI